MKKLLNVFLLLVIAMSAQVLADDCGGAIPCNCGDTLVEDHVMTYDLNDCVGNGIEFGADYLELDCNGHSIDGDDTGTDYGIKIMSYNFTNVHNCVVSEFYYGLYAGITDSGDIYDNEVHSTNYAGAWLQYATNTEFYNNILDNNAVYGLLLSQSDYNIIRDNNVTNTGYAIRFWDSDFNELHGNRIEYNDRGIQHDSGIYNLLWNNYFANNLVFNALEFSSVTTSDWNLSTTGNYWDDFVDNAGYPDYYEVEGSGTGIDFYPIPYICGDGVCDGVNGLGENCNNCLEDCGCTGGRQCSNILSEREDRYRCILFMNGGPTSDSELSSSLVRRSGDGFL